MSEPRVATYANVVPAMKAVIGSKVVNQQDEYLGKIEDVAVDVEAGRIAYAVLSFGGFLGIGDKYFAIPWEAFRFNMTDKRAILNVDRKLLENAPGFDKDNLPSMTSSRGSRVFPTMAIDPNREEPATGAGGDRF
ncbi:MAG: PRC-barrel domain-containing protein [Candidatus Acidiferrales bacterium]